MMHFLLSRMLIGLLTPPSGDPETITLRQSPGRVLPLCAFEMKDSRKPARNRWTLEITHLASRVLEPLIVYADIGRGDGVTRNIFQQRVRDVDALREAQQQLKEQVGLICVLLYLVVVILVHRNDLQKAFSVTILSLLSVFVCVCIIIVGLVISVY